MLLSSLLALLPLTLAATLPGQAVEERRSRVSPNEEHTLAKRGYSGRATFYDVGLGACGQNNVASDFIVALNSAQYGSGYPGPNCFKSITISYGGKTTTATIMDQCPTCGYGDLDFSRGLFDYFASESLGTFQMSWSFNDGSEQQATSTTPTSTYTPPTSTYTPPTSTYTPPTTTQEPTTTSSPTPTPTSTTPASTSTSTDASAIFSSASAASASSLSGSTLHTSSGLNIAVVSSVSVSATTISGSVVPLAAATGLSSSSSGSDADAAAREGLGNLVLLNSVVTNYGNLVVLGGRAIE